VPVGVSAAILRDRECRGNGTPHEAALCIRRAAAVPTRVAAWNDPGHDTRTGDPAVNPNRDEKTGQYATFWKGSATLAALILMWFFVFSGWLGYGG
jgi:hypothetical protein